MNEEYGFDDMLDSYGGQDQMPSNFDFSSMDFTPNLLNLPEMAPVNYAMPPIDMSQYGFGSMDMGPAATPLSSVDQAYLNQLNSGMPAQKSFGDYAKQYGPYLMSPNPLAAILINKLSGIVGDSIGGKEGQLAQTGTSSLLSGVNTALSEAGGRASEGISSLLPKSDDPSLVEEYLSKAAPNVGAQLVTALLTGNKGSLAPLVRNALLGAGKGMAADKVFGSITGD